MQTSKSCPNLTSIPGLDYRIENNKGPIADNFVIIKNDNQQFKSKLQNLSIGALGKEDGLAFTSHLIPASKPTTLHNSSQLAKIRQDDGENSLKAYLKKHGWSERKIESNLASCKKKFGSGYIRLVKLVADKFISLNESDSSVKELVLKMAKHDSMPGNSQGLEKMLNKIVNVSVGDANSTAQKVLDVYKTRLLPAVADHLKTLSEGTKVSTIMRDAHQALPDLDNFMMEGNSARDFEVLLDLSYQFVDLIGQKIDESAAEDSGKANNASKPDTNYSGFVHNGHPVPFQFKIENNSTYNPPPQAQTTISENSQRASSDKNVGDKEKTLLSNLIELLYKNGALETNQKELADKLDELHKMIAGMRHPQPEIHTASDDAASSDDDASSEENAMPDTQTSRTASSEQSSSDAESTATSSADDTNSTNGTEESDDSQDTTSTNGTEESDDSQDTSSTNGTEESDDSQQTTSTNGTEKSDDSQDTNSNAEGDETQQSTTANSEYHSEAFDENAQTTNTDTNAEDERSGTTGPDDNTTGNNKRTDGNTGGRWRPKKPQPLNFDTNNIFSKSTYEVGKAYRTSDAFVNQQTKVGSDNATGTGFRGGNGMVTKGNTFVTYNPKLMNV